MQRRVWIVAVLVAAPVLVSGCATRNWVRETLGQQQAVTDQRIAGIESQVREEKIRVEGMGTRLVRVESGVEEAARRAEAAHGRADAAFQRAEEVDQRLTRLWSKRHARQLVDSVDVTFGFDRWELSDGAQTALLGIVRELQANPALTVDLAGYTDPKGPRPYNITLSQRRVEAVRRFLVSQGVELPRINSIGLGVLEDRSIPDAKKRRVTVRLMVPAE
jgi:outer membrane protein OmpA-like peptidoglycan-associated protein